MFNPLTRTLKLGLTAITILTAGGFAGTAFAQVSVEYCGNGTNYDRPECRNIVNKPNAANWAKRNRGTTNRIELDARGIPIHSHIVRGLRTSLDTNGGSVNTAGTATNHTTLNLSNQSFNGKRLGGDATDGVGYFYRIIRGHGGQHAGIFAGTDLGAPVTGPAGTARWVGRTLVGGLWANTDFVLEVTFGNAGPGKVGSVAAFIPYYHSYWGRGHIYLKAKFDATGYIWGTATAGRYRNNRVFSRDIRFGGAGRLHGLIGKEGAVGSFVSGGGWFAGGFVARPAEDVEGAAVYLKELCTDDSSHEFCFVSDARINTIVNNCIDNPFGTTASKYGSGGCVKTLGANRHETETTQRITLCNNGGSEAGNSLCQHTEVIAGICAYSPFAPVCLKGNHNSAGRTSTKFNACRATGPSEPTCHGVSPELEPSDKKPNTATWADSFVTKSSPAELPSAAEVGKRSQFLKGGKSDLDKTGISVQEHGALHFETAPVDDNNPLAGLIAGNPNPNSGADVGKEGVAFFWGYKGQYAFYSGILEDTDLGAPVNSVSRTTATWKGKFQSLWFTTKTDFDLEVAFGGGEVGTISARVANNGRKTSFSHFFIDGTFDNNGLITGSILAGKFTGGERANVRGTTYPGILRGLIGEEGAVGSFIAGTSSDNGNILTGNNYYSGGFIATPPSVVDHADWVEVFEPATRPATPAITQFLAGDAALIVNANPNRVVTFATATYNNIPLDGAATNNGFATNNDGSSNYAGLLSGVNLGAPLTAQTAVGVWRGYLESYTQTGSNSPNFTLTVNFGAGSKAGTISATPSQHVIAGDFDDRGVIDGTVTRTHGDDVREATLTGLIGSGGAIGVFHNNEEGPRSLVGGFIACPYDSVNNRCK